jgi:hypothetical protein
MTSIEAPDRSDHHSIGLIVAAMLSWIPPVVVLVILLTSRGLQARVPTHWSPDGRIDGWSSMTGDLWTTLPAGFVGSVLVTAIVIFGGNNIPRVKGSLGLAGIVLLCGGISFTLLVSIATARQPDLTGQSFGILAAASVVLAGLVFAAGALPRRNALQLQRSPAPPADDR